MSPNSALFWLFPDCVVFLMHGGLAPRHRGQVSTLCWTRMLQVRGSVFLRGPSDVCPCAICLAERLHMALFIRGLRRVRATGALHQWWQVILIIISKTVTAVTNAVFDYTATQYFKNFSHFSRIMPLMHLIKDRRSVAITGMSTKQLWLWPGVAYNEKAWLTKDIEMPACVRWEECKINFGIWGIFFPAHKQPWPVKSWLTGLWLAGKNSNSISFSELPQSLAKKNNCIALHFIFLT